MRSFQDPRSKTTGLVSDKLDTPSSAGFRPGMTCSSVIARKLGVVYDVNQDVPKAIQSALQALDRRMARAR